MGVNGTNMTQEQWDSNVASIRKGMQTATPTTGIPAGVDPAYHASVVQSYNDSLLRRPADQASANTAIAQEKSANPAAWGIPPTITAKPPTQMSSTNNMPTAQPMSAQQSAPPDYAALASARFAAGLANKRTIAQQQKASADTAYQQQTLRTNDNRTLQDFSRTQTPRPFGNLGRTSFQEGLIGRERTQADADSAASLASQKSNIDQLLASYESATADEQVRIADELQARDQQYQLQLAGVTGNLNGQRTLQGQQLDSGNKFAEAGLTGNYNNQRTIAGQTLDYNQNPNNPQNQGQLLQNKGQALQNQLSQFKIDDYPAEQKANATKVQQELESGQITNETAKFKLDQLKDPESPTNQAQKLELQMKQMEAANLPEKQRLELQQLRKTIEQIGVVHYKPQTEAEIAQDKVTIATANQQLKDIESGKTTSVKGQTAQDYTKDIDSSMYVSPEYTTDQYGTQTKTGKTTVNDADGLESYIYSLGLSNSETYKLLQRYKLVK